MGTIILLVVLIFVVDYRLSRIRGELKVLNAAVKKAVAAAQP